MNLLYKRILYLVLPVVTILVVAACDDEDDKGGFLKPAVVEATPAEALIGSTVAIRGENLDKVSKVKFGSIDAASFTATANEITVTVPEGLAEGSTKITVFYTAASENNLGPSDDTDFIVLYAPELAATDPVEIKPGFEIAITGNYLAKTLQVKFGELEAAFEATQNEITTTVPADAAAGLVDITVTTPGGSTTIPFTILERTPEIYGFSPAEGVKTGEIATINGIFFIDVQSVQLGDTEITDFEVISENEITFTMPDGVSTDDVTVTTALGTVTSDSKLAVIEIPFVLFEEGLHTQMQNWGWGGSDDFENTDVAKAGINSYLRTYNEAWSGIQLHHGTLNLSHYSAVTFSVYGAPGTDDKQLQLTINWGPMVQIPVTPGAWTDFTIPLADLGNPAVLDNLIFQDNGNTGPATPFSVYIDSIVFVE